MKFILFIAHVFFYLAHPCDKGNNGGCGQICNNNEDKYFCSCNEGFKLSPNGVSCIQG